MKALVLDWYDGVTGFIVTEEGGRIRQYFWDFETTGDGEYPRQYIGDQNYYEVKRGDEFKILSEEDVSFVYTLEEWYE